MTQLGIGCAALGGNVYGNNAKPIKHRDVARMLRIAYAAGVRHFDSAEAYGLANRRIKEASLKGATLATKIMPGEWPAFGFDICYFHDGRFNEDVAATLHSKGFIVGVSVYTMEEALEALKSRYLEYLQVPVSLIDRRFVEPGFVAKCHAAGIGLVGRSILLQGVLSDSPLPVVKREELLKQLRRLLPKIDPFRYIFRNLENVLDVALIGVATMEQVTAAVEHSKSTKPPLSDDELAQCNEAIGFAMEYGLLDPRSWNQPL